MSCLLCFPQSITYGDHRTCISKFNNNLLYGNYSIPYTLLQEGNTAVIALRNGYNVIWDFKNDFIENKLKCLEK